MSMSDIKTLVIQDETGKVVDLGVMNPKAHQKSLENKVLWVVHEETGRVLPYREEAGEHRISSIEKADFGYTARLKAGVSGAAGSNDATVSGGYSGTVSGSDESSGSGSVERSAIIRRLAGVIARRHAEMPEGSYTTHLFTKGPDKIRKKLGEEAVEVILARENEEVIYESADLIYHLLVLLESLDLSIEDVFAELESRE